MQEKSQALSQALQKLAVFVGEWQGTGTFLEGAGPGAGSTLQVHETYEWLPGGYFLIDNSSLNFGVGALEAHRVISYDEEANQYIMHAFDSIGFAREYKGNLQGSKWHFNGELERVTITLGADSKKLSTFWENSADGKIWRPLCKTEQTKK
jgi:hypothetical protein